MKVKARSKYLDLRNNFSSRQLYSIIGYVFVLCLCAVLLFVWIQDWLISLTFLFCAVGGFFVFTASAREFSVEITEDNLLLDEYEIKLTEVISWAVVDLGETLEVVLRIKNYSTPYLYFYIEDNEEDSFALIRKMRDNIPYDAQMPNQNYIHRLLRRLNLK